MSKMLKRRTSVNHLYQMACLVVNPGNHSVYDAMIHDWNRTEIKKIIEDCGTKTCNFEEMKAGERKASSWQIVSPSFFITFAFLKG